MYYGCGRNLLLWPSTYILTSQDTIKAIYSPLIHKITIITDRKSASVILCYDVRKFEIFILFCGYLPIYLPTYRYLWSKNFTFVAVEKGCRSVLLICQSVVVLHLCLQKEKVFGELKRQVHTEKSRMVVYLLC